MPRPCPITKIQGEELIALYLAGHSRNSLALRFDASRPFVNDFLQRNGVPVRGIKEGSRLANCFAVDHEAFAHPLGHEGHYWAGFLMADGCIFPDRNKTPHIILGLSAEDHDQVVAFRTFLKSEHSVTMVSPTTRYHKGKAINTGPGVRIDVTSDRLAADLALCGVVPDKTKRTQVLLGLDQSVAFWRGCIDGDGWVGVARRKRDGSLHPRINLTGSHSLLTQWSAFMRTITNCKGTVLRDKGVWQCGAFGRHAIRLMCALYSQDGPSLKRKREAALSLVAQHSDLLDDSIGYHWKRISNSRFG